MKKKLKILIYILIMISLIKISYPRSIAAVNAFKIAIGDLKTGNYKLAIEGFKKALKLDSNYIDARFGLGVAYIQIKNFDKAIKQLKIVKQLRRNHTPTIYWLAIAYKGKGDIDKALNLFNECLSKEKNFEDAYFQIGIIFFDKKDYNKALENFEQVIKINKKNADAYFNIALIYYYKNKKNEAINTLKKGLKYIPDNLQLLYFLGYLNAFIYKFNSKLLLNKESLRYFYQLIQYSKQENKNINKDNIYVMLSDMFITYINYQYKKSEKIALDIISKYKNTEEPYLILAMINYLKENKKQSLEYINQGLKINPDNKELKKLKNFISKFMQDSKNYYYKNNN